MEKTKDITELVNTVKEFFGIQMHNNQIRTVKEMYKGNIINIDSGEGKTIRKQGIGC